MFDLTFVIYIEALSSISISFSSLFESWKWHFLLFYFFLDVVKLIESLIRLCVCFFVMSLF